MTKKKLKEKFTVTIELGARVWFERPDRTVETYVFRGTDSKGTIFEDDKGVMHYEVLSRPYTKIASEHLGNLV